MREKGTVIGKTDTSVIVEVERTSSCTRCGLCKLGETGRATLEARNDVGAEVGDTVEVEMESRNVLAAAFVAYMVPIFFMFLGFFAGYSLAAPLGFAKSKETVGAVMGIGFLASSYVFVRLYDRLAGKRLLARATRLVR